MRALLLTLLITETVSTILTSSNVVFTEEKKFGSSKAYWNILVTLNTQVFHDDVTTAHRDITQLQNLVNLLSLRNQTVIQEFKEELVTAIASLKDIAREYDTFRTLIDVEETHDVKRMKRSILPFIGSALKTLFGTVTKNDLEHVKRNIGQLQNSQREILHLTLENLTILKHSVKGIETNRKFLNHLSNNLRKFHRDVQTVTNNLSDNILRLKTATEGYFHLRSLNAQVKITINELKSNIEELKHKLDILSVQKITPSIIPPTKFMKILNQIALRLPSSLSLPLRPESNLWSYYRALTCNTLVTQHNLIVVIKLPLQIDSEVFSLIQAHNLPLPMPQNNNIKMSITAKYVIESNFIAVDQNRYMLLTTNEYETCKQDYLGFCNLKSPIYPLNLQRHCVTALYKGDPEAVNKLCKTSVLLNTQLPEAEYLAEGSWAVSSSKTLNFHVKCTDETTSKLTARHPIDIIKVPPGCSASSDFLSLNPYYVQQSSVKMNLTKPVKRTQITFPDLSLWKPLLKHTSDSESFHWSKELDEFESIEMQPLINRITSTKTTCTPIPSTYRYMSITAFVLSLLLFTMLIATVTKIYVSRAHSTNENELPSGESPLEISSPINEAPHPQHDARCPNSKSTEIDTNTI